MTGGTMRAPAGADGHRRGSGAVLLTQVIQPLRARARVGAGAFKHGRGDTDTGVGPKLSLLQIDVLGRPIRQ